MHIIIVMILSGCSSTSQLLGSWSSPTSEPKSYSNLGIVALLPNLSSKATVESNLAAMFNEQGIKAISTMGLFPFADNPDIYKDQMSDPEFVRNKIRERLNKFNIDGLLIVSLLDTEKVQHYRERANFSVSVPAYVDSYYGYYSYAFGAVYSTGYYEVETTYFIDANLYDVASEKLIWSGQTKSQNPKSVDEESKKLSKVVVEDILQRGAVKP